VELPVGDVDHLRDVPAQIEERVELDGPLVLAEAGPREERETEIDRRGIERVDGGLQVDPQRLAGVERLGKVDENLGEVGHDAPVAGLVRVGQGAARHAASDTHVVEFRLHRAETRFDVAQALAVRELGKRETEELIETREAPDLVIALVARHAGAELGQREQVHHLREDRATGMHGALLWEAEVPSVPGT
jgi:hypothetical protein